MNIDLTTITSTDFTQISRLLHRKESLLAKVAAINAKLQAFPNAKGRRAGLKRGHARASAPATSRNGAQHGALKAKVIRQLKTAGKNGLAIKELATKLGAKYGNMSSWFQSTGKRIKEIKKVGPGKYSWVA